MQTSGGESVKDIKRHLTRLISLSLNGDQANYIAEQVDSTFNLHRESGFRESMSVPAQVAAETIVEYFTKEEDLIRYFEHMLDREGVFLFNSTISLKGSEKFMELLAKKRWIFDRDLRQFLRDPFYQESINFFNSLSPLDLRQDIDLDAMIHKIQQHGENIHEMDLEWSIVIRLYGLDRKRDEFLRRLVEFLLSKQKLEAHTFNIYTCLKEVATNAGKANYKHLFTRSILGDSEDMESGYRDVLEQFKKEIEDNGDANLLKMAQDEDLYFDIVFKSNAGSVSIWVCNYIPISRVEKQRLVTRLRLNHFDTGSAFDQGDQLMEGAGLGLNLIMKIMAAYGESTEPIKAVFYPDSTKIGFVLDRQKVLARKPGPG